MAARIHFDPERAKGPADRAESVSADVTGQFGRKPPAALSVSALVAKVKGALTDALPASLAVVGEISNFKRPTSGHLYFSLKDADAQIAAVMFRSAASKLSFTPADGMSVVARGRADVYEAQGKLQLYVESLRLEGAGELELALRQLRDRLAAEGLFDPGRKRLLPKYPRVIGVVTSPTGAAVRDIGRTLKRRWPCAKVVMIGTAVQGDRAAGEIAAAIRAFDANADRLGLDVLIVGRGGGSLEDLWAFNEEPVVRAIYDCRVPVISGVGHEVDTTLADLVADVRAATPTAAAELAAPDVRDVAGALARMQQLLGRRLQLRWAEASRRLDVVARCELFRTPLARVQSFAQRVDELTARLGRGLKGRSGDTRQRLDRLGARLRWSLGHLAKRRGDQLSRAAQMLAQAHPRSRVRLAQRDVDALTRQMQAMMRTRLAGARQSLDQTRRTLEALSYKSALRRGYSVTRAGGQIVRSVEQLPPGKRLVTELADGRIGSIVEGKPRRRRRSIDTDDQPLLFDPEDHPDNLQP